MGSTAALVDLTFGTHLLHFDGTVFRQKQRSAAAVRAQPRSPLDDFRDAVGVNSHRLVRAEVNDEAVVARRADIPRFAECVAGAVVQANGKWPKRSPLD